MRRTLVSAILGLLVIAVSANVAQAFGCKTNLSQYNAFSPITVHSVTCSHLFCHHCTWVVECCPHPPAPLCPPAAAPAAGGAAAPAGAAPVAPQATQYPGNHIHPGYVGQPSMMPGAQSPRMYNGPVPMNTPWQGQTFPVGRR